jgi:hypothetical protein
MIVKNVGFVNLLILNELQKEESKLIQPISKQIHIAHQKDEIC